MIPFAAAESWLIAWSASVLTGAAIGVWKRNWRWGVGWGLMVVPLWIGFVAFLNSIPVLASGSSVIRAIPSERLTRMWSRAILQDIGYMGAGFLVWKGIPENLTQLAKQLRESGLWPGKGEAASTRVGYVTFPVLLLGTVAVDLLLRSGLPALVNGDESQVWINMDPIKAVMLSAAAAFTEELQYRVLLLGILIWLGEKLHLGRWNVAVMVVVQAIFFGFAHSGYGTWVHVILPFLFGLVSGIAAVRFGLWSAIVLHFLVDFYVFSSYVIAHDSVYQAFVFLTLLANIAYALYAGGSWLHDRRNQARNTELPEA